MKASNTIHGLWAPALTPLVANAVPEVPRATTTSPRKAAADLAIDHGEAVAHVQRLLQQGCHGVVLFGTTGEAASFSVRERCALLEAVLAAGVAPERLIIGSGCCALSDSIALSQHALSLQCNKLLVLPPFFFKDAGENGLFEYYVRLIESLDERARLLLYHIPQYAMEVPGTLVRALIENYGAVIAGFKDSAGNMRDTLSRIRDFPELSVFAGSEMSLTTYLAAGGAGCITATANINAEAVRKVWDLYHKNARTDNRVDDRASKRAQGRAEISAAADNSVDEETATAQVATDNLRAVFDQMPMVSALKWVVAKRESNDNWLATRPPLQPLGILDAERIMEELGSV